MPHTARPVSSVIKPEPDARGSRRGGGNTGQLGVGRRDLGQLRIDSPESNQFLRPFEQFHYMAAQLAPGCGLPTLAPASQGERQPGHKGDAGEKSECEDDAGLREEIPDKPHSRDAHDQGDAVRGDHPEHEVLERVDIPHKASEEVPAPEVGQPRGGQ